MQDLSVEIVRQLTNQSAADMWLSSCVSDSCYLFSGMTCIVSIVTTQALSCKNFSQEHLKDDEKYWSQNWPEENSRAVSVQACLNIMCEHSGMTENNSKRPQAYQAWPSDSIITAQYGGWNVCPILLSQPCWVHCSMQTFKLSCVSWKLVVLCYSLLCSSTTSHVLIKVQQ